MEINYIDHQDMVNIMEIDDDINEDRISQLPDSVLTLILSFMSTREAVRTSAVSARWRSLFKFPTILVLDAHNMLDSDKYSEMNVSQMLCLERGIVKMKRTVEFMNVVCYYLHCVRDVQKIEKLRVHFTFGNRYACLLNRWIGFALKRRVEEIDLFLLEDDYFSAVSEGPYIFPCGLLVGIWSLKRLRLAHCVLAPPEPQWSISYGFSTLTTLELMKVDLVSDDHVQNLLWNCHNIESLSLCVCWNLHYLRIEYPLCQKLMYLNVNDCPHLKTIELTGLNVETLEYKGRFVRFQFHNTPRLRTVFTGVNDCRISYSNILPLYMLPVDLPQLQTLLLESTCHMAEAMCIPRFPNVQHLIILKLPKHEHDFSWISSILKAFPGLQKLELHLRTNSNVGEELKDRNRPPKCLHEQLKEVVISGTMRGHRSEMEIAIYLLKNATSLEKMEIDPRLRVYKGNGKWNQLEPHEIWSMTEKHEVEHHLSQHASAAVQLSIL